MLRKRVIFTLIYSQGSFNLSRNFKLQRVGDINWLEKNYRFKEIAFSIDELIVLNASRGNKDTLNFASLVTKLKKDIFVPLAVGGGIYSLDDAKIFFENGADKLVINTSLSKNPELVKELIKIYGSQSIVASIDYQIINGEKRVFINNGQESLEILLDDYIKNIENLGVGEIYLNSIEKDGTGFGYDFETIDIVSEEIKIPIIIAGGAGNSKHLIEGLVREKVDAVATANLFNFVGDGLPKARREILDNNLNIANWR